jgi:pimeloyl-ACP methyl ester carboxylesterase
MPIAKLPSGLDIAWEEFSGEGPTILLIMGLGAQMLWWPTPFCEQLAARGFRVIRFDNRDVGLSSRLRHLEPPPWRLLAKAALLGRRIESAYTLEDMAQDTLDLLDHLSLGQAHLVGASMGGMIAQTVCLQAPERVQSLTSIMSTTGNPTVSRPSKRALLAILRRPGDSREAAMRSSVRVWTAIGSRTIPQDEEGIRDIAGRCYDRGPTGLGFLRQVGAIYASGDRTRRLKSLKTPTLVIHGAQDPLMPVSAGRATARTIPDAKLLILPEMGHDLPKPYWPQMLDTIAAHVRDSHGEPEHA